ncbi:hypothetical protein I8752_34805 [Nostocaceae cyanobacterium CENA369]|uniref:Uncharacterized protein n=1 Tax=Dendronalium phyllosphericum CENA369 TaxID=1725256 RepID=A0A8J7IEJ9_9NOST|nr:hypothetical protein [Dendronalium phyllosphericum]MBH8578028.1 hypothetical protein [Dendronalium phyllosphericum CENA369]
MIVTVRDPDILSNLDPQILTSYLQAKGWKKESQVDNKESVWIKTTDSGEEFDITLPLNPGIRSYALRMAEILAILEKVEVRSQLDILSDLITKIPNTEIQGLVIKLAERNHPGNVTIIGFVVGKPRQINLSLSESEYNQARTAYHQRLPVVCTGDLIKENDAFVLKKITSFALYNTLTERAAV